MKLKYLGTAAAEGFPAAFCNCEHCKKARENVGAELRTRSQAMVDGKLLIDFPAETYLHAVRYGTDLSAIENLLVTHSHTDHFYAQELCNRGYRFALNMTAPVLNIYGNSEVHAVFEEGTRRELRPAVAESLRFHTQRRQHKSEAKQNDNFLCHSIKTNTISTNVSSRPEQNHDKCINPLI